jgi:hypothetical protein
MMKIIKIFLFTIFLTVVGFSCEEYEDFLTDYDFSAVYFATQKPLRTIVAYDKMTFKVGVALAGKRENTTDEWVSYKIEPSLLDDTGFILLPEEYYSISDSETMIIPKGKFLGDVTITLDRSAFTSDPLAHLNTYAIPLRAYETSADSILAGNFDKEGNVLTPAKDYTVLVVKYISPLHGTYYHKGIQRKLDDSGEVVEEKAYSTSDLSKNQTWDLSTEALNEVETSGAGTFVTQGNSRYGLRLIRNEDNTVTIEEVSGSNITLLEGEGSYDADKREFLLDYKFLENGVEYHVTDNLILRQAPELDLRFEEW